MRTHHKTLALSALLLPQLVLGIVCNPPKSTPSMPCIAQTCASLGECPRGYAFANKMTTVVVDGLCTAARGCQVDPKLKPKCLAIAGGDPVEAAWSLRSGCTQNRTCGLSFSCPDAPKCELKGPSSNNALTCSDPSSTGRCGTGTASDYSGTTCVPHACNPTTATMMTTSTIPCQGKQANQECTLPYVCTDTLCKPEKPVVGKCTAGTAPQPTPMPTAPGMTPTGMPSAPLACVVAGGNPQIACILR